MTANWLRVSAILTICMVCHLDSLLRCAKIVVMPTDNELQSIRNGIEKHRDAVATNAKDIAVLTTAFESGIKAIEESTASQSRMSKITNDKIDKLSDRLFVAIHGNPKDTAGQPGMLRRIDRLESFRQRVGGLTRWIGSIIAGLIVSGAIAAWSMLKGER